MQGKKSQPRKKRMTLDDFALLIQKDLARMATKKDLEPFATKKDLERFATKADLDSVRDRINVLGERLEKQIAGLHYAKEIDELRSRVNILEHKLGIKPAHRAA